MNVTNEQAASFDQKTSQVLQYLNSKKLNAKQYSMTYLFFYAISFAISMALIAGQSSTLETLNSVGFFTFFPKVLVVITTVGLIISWSLISFRINDIVHDVNKWPYLILALLVSFIPVLGLIMIISLAFVPTQYINKDKENKLLKKFA